ncbi:MAG: hypothetical protein K6U04_13835 [Armatimonadetes bacterium]|nr:hypothetical protein [Armatimonadota bacterium]
MLDALRLISLLAVAISAGVIIFIYSKRNNSSERVIPQKIMSFAFLAMSLTLVSFTWRYEHITPFMQLLLVTGVGASLIFISIMVRLNSLILATYVVIIANLLALMHLILVFS